MNCEDCMYFNQNDNYPGHLGWCDVDLPNWIYEAMTIDITKITPEKLAEMNNSLMVDNNHLRQQLAAALAAIKVKDAVLGDIAECIGAGRLRVASAEAIAIQPDDSALQAFAAKVREQCAQLCLDLQGKMVSGGSSINYWKRNAAPKDCAEAIRNLNELPK